MAVAKAIQKAAPDGRFYAVDSTTIDLCMSLFYWAKFRNTKSGIKIHTQVDIVTEIPVFYRITNANVHDVNAMDWLTYEPLACYVFDRGYFDLIRLYQIDVSGAFFIIREKRHPAYEVVDGEDVLDGADNVLHDQTIVLTKKQNKAKYPGRIRRIVYYAPDLHRTFTYYTNNFYLAAKDIALLYSCHHHILPYRNHRTRPQTWTSNHTSHADTGQFLAHEG